MYHSTKVWDLPLRLFHWLMVAGFFAAYFTEEDFLTLHVWAGYLVFGLLMFRLIWGFIGYRYARFSNFVCTPSQSIGYVKELMTGKAKRYLGHNPAGAAMIVLLLLSLLITTATGFAVYGAEEQAGPLAGVIAKNGHFWEELHEFFANFTVFLVVLHVGGVIVESLLHHENLVKAMISGYKRSEDSADD
ncbi:MAG: cytochrome b/b6 domain-containing protein [Gammaproteobacteria bacterium]